MANGKWEKVKPMYGVRVNGHGPTPAYLMLVAAKPEKGDPHKGRLMTGMVGVELDRYLRLSGHTLNDVYLTTVVKEWQDEEPTDEQMAMGLGELLLEIEDVQPVVLVTLGRAAARLVLGGVDMDTVRGIAFPAGLCHAPLPGVHWVYPCTHPAAGLVSGDNVPAIHSDFLGLGELDLREWTPDAHPAPEYRPHHGADRLDPALPLGLDSEGFRHDVWSAQWSQRPGAGYIVYPNAVRDWAGMYNKFWSAGGITAIHNSLHDLNVLPEVGVHVRDGSFIDTMVYAYLLSDVPQGLKPLAFRLAGMEMGSYEDAVAPAKASVEEEWLAAAEAVADAIPHPDLELVWDDKGERWRVKQPQSVAQRIRRIRTDLAKGKVVDIKARVANWEDEAAAQLLLAAGEVTEPTLRDIPRADAERYACRDADATVRILPHLRRRIEDEGMEEVAEIDHAIIPMVNAMQQSGFLIDKEHFNGMDTRLTQQMSDKRDEIADMVGVRINPGSSDQVAALLFKQLGLPSRKLTKGGDESTQAKVLEGMRRDHPVIPLILEYRHFDKMRGSFARKLPRLADSDGRVRGNIRITRTASGRMAMNTPNLMAIPVRTALGRELRRGFIAAPGNVICNFDLDQIEMREITDVSQDPLLLELFHDPSRDIHTETAARMFDKPLGAIDPKTERYAAKRVGFGIATQITGAGLVDQMELAGATHADGSKWTEDECDNLIELWFGVYPRVRVFIDRTKAEVRRDGVVRDRWGRLRHLEGAWSGVGRIREEALRQGPSHKIQSGAQGVMKRNMAAIWARVKSEGLMDHGFRFLLQIHDSLMAEHPEWMTPIVSDIMTEGMEQTCRPWYSVPITASGEYGANWGEMEEAE